MVKVLVNKKEYAVELDKKDSSKGTIDGKDFALDLIRLKEGSFHVLLNNKSYTIEVVKRDTDAKSLAISVNGNKYTVNVKDKYDELLKTLGLDEIGKGKVSDIKAPMPGLVLDILIKEGSAIKKGDSVIILEAMKMENVLKAPADGIIKKINVNKGIAVEKNQILITLS